MSNSETLKMIYQGSSYLYLSFGAFAGDIITGFTVGMKTIQTLDGKIRVLSR